MQLDCAGSLKPSRLELFRSLGQTLLSRRIVHHMLTNAYLYNSTDRLALNICAHFGFGLAVMASCLHSAVPSKRYRVAWSVAQELS